MIIGYFNLILYYLYFTLAVDGKLDTNLPNCAIMDNYYVDKPLWRVDLGSKVTVNGAVILTWQGAGQGRSNDLLFSDLSYAIHIYAHSVTVTVFHNSDVKLYFNVKPC